MSTNRNEQIISMAMSWLREKGMPSATMAPFEIIAKFLKLRDMHAETKRDIAWTEQADMLAKELIESFVADYALSHQNARLSVRDAFQTDDKILHDAILEGVRKYGLSFIRPANIHRLMESQGTYVVPAPLFSTGQTMDVFGAILRDGMSVLDMDARFGENFLAACVVGIPCEYHTLAGSEQMVADLRRINGALKRKGPLNSVYTAIKGWAEYPKLLDQQRDVVIYPIRLFGWETFEHNEHKDRYFTDWEEYLLFIEENVQKAIKLTKPGGWTVFQYIPYSWSRGPKSSDTREDDDVCADHVIIPQIRQVGAYRNETRIKSVDTRQVTIYAQKAE